LHSAVFVEQYAEGLAAPRAYNGTRKGPPMWRNLLSLMQTHWLALSLCSVAVIIVLVVMGTLKTVPPTQAESDMMKREAALARLSTAALQEWQTARADHQAIVFAVVPCLQLATLSGQPGPLSSELLLTMLPTGENQRHLTANHDTPYTTLKITSFHRAAIYLSHAVARARVEAMGSAHDSYSRMQYFQIATVIIGAITTILISIKSTSIDNTRLSLLIGILAIIFSSVGTATSALNSFYSPREGYIKNQKSSSVLRKLHMDIATTVSSQAESDTCTPMTEDNSKKS
jgi:Protein of unknown function (DUF4231)